MYALEDAGGAEILSYHWHPEGRSAVREPHLHLGPSAKVGLTILANAHLPTGRLALVNILRLAISEFGVVPRRDDWADVFAGAEYGYGT
jgi:hypothetical protein